MKWTAIFPVFAVVLALAGSSFAANQSLPMLTKSDARYYLKVALKRNFRGAYRSQLPEHIQPHIKACTRLSRIRVRCGAEWLSVNGYLYKGRGIIWYSKPHAHVLWNYSYVIREYLCGEGVCTLIGPDGFRI
jgi:hypothetical protein